MNVRGGRQRILCGCRGLSPQKEIQTSTLAKILDQYFPKSTQIDFLSIDVEGLDIKVLSSNDWGRYQPNVILIEILGSSLDDLMHNDITLFLNEFGYSIYCQCIHTAIFKNNKASH
jgi:hypothetical protein